MRVRVRIAPISGRLTLLCARVFSGSHFENREDPGNEVESLSSTTREEKERGPGNEVVFEIDLFSFLRHCLVTWPEMGKQTKHSR